MTSLLSIHGCTPADLQNMGLTALFLLGGDPNLNASPPSSIEEPASENSTLTAPNQILTPDSNSGTLTPLRASVVKARPVKVPKPRSKIARLPEHIQANLNTMLASGCAYADIIRNLNDHGYPGFNKVNLHTWKVRGFQEWLRAENSEPSLEGVQKVSEGVQKPVEGDSNS